MKLNQLLSLNAILALAAGIAFALYGPIMLAIFGVSEIAANNDAGYLLYWNTASFARMFGAALFGFGLLLWSVRGLAADPAASPEAKRGILSALLLANAMGAFVSVTQQSQIWTGFAGWVMFAIFTLFLLGYVFAFATGKDKQVVNP